MKSTPTSSVCSVIAGNKDATGIGMDVLGNFLFVSDAFNHVASFRIDWETGVPRPAATVPTPLQAVDGNIVTDASGQYVYVIQSPNATAAYKLDFAAGNLTPIGGSPFPTGPKEFAVILFPALTWSP